MENSMNLKKHGMAERMSHHPLGTAVGGLAAAAICGVLGGAHGEVVAVVMAVLGAAVGAPLGAMMVASGQQED